jgi:ketosteroid isomerase-like protein
VTPAELATAYFEAIRGRDVEGIRRMFAPDAELTTAFGVTQGADAIAGFYRDYAFGFDDLWPELEPLIVDGNRVAVEITLTAAGQTTKVADVFEIEGEHIRRLTIYGQIAREEG